ncbi:MAG: hypothetical protein O7E52_21115 [Candidatus Poribacteria bacterium]|nr:hypothetical protein [Candidatus Poribacteria bacterium]
MSQLDPIRVNYVSEFTKLSLWFVHKRLCEGERDFERLVNGRVNIYRNTSLYDGKRHPSGEDVGPEWADILARLRAVFDYHVDAPSTEQLEAAGLDLLWPYLKARLIQEGNPLPSLEDRPYECWDYDYNGNRLNIHIANLYQPRSPLSDMHIPFAVSLIRLLHDSLVRRPDIEVVRCGSWLNSAPPFQALFPERWNQSAQPRPDVRYTMGHWGQFMDRRGDFHARNGALFRETGEFPFPNLSCESPIEEVLAHLAEHFPKAVAYNVQRGYVPQV